MKKFIYLLIWVSFLFSYQNFRVYTYGIKLNYKEYKNSKVIDRDYSSFSDLLGVGIKYKTVFNKILFDVKVEYASGNSIYEGATWSGKPLKMKQSDVSILDIEASLGYKYFYFLVGYREWNRGSSGYEGDYNEIYYWPYFGIKSNYKFGFKNFYFSPEIAYIYVINPEIKIELGNYPVLSLGDTDGGYITLPFVMKFSNFNIDFFYRFEYWHISSSKPGLLIVDGEGYVIYEPESITKNQYLGAGFTYKF